ncbi:MAG: hypothetical protein FWH12_04000 [Treponema sp.]|nr:hypothetical protein [Treponema sp.]
MKKVAFPSHLRYTIPIILGLFLLTFSLHAQVERSELEGHGPVEFINYEGPYARIETRDQIREIGSSLGQLISAGNQRAGALNRYFVIQSRSAPDGSLLDSDIFGLGIDVAVDHIRNLRLIIQGYLEATYNYSQADAALLASYITVYNAVFRGDMRYFGTRFKQPVMENLSAERAGLSIRYDEWPGQALMLIPIGAGLGGPLSIVDTSAITDARVIEQLRQDPDMGLDMRRDMVDLQEREAEEAARIAAALDSAAQAEALRIAEERAELARAEQQIREEELRIAQERMGADQAELEALMEREAAAREHEEYMARMQQDLEEREREAEELRRLAELEAAFAEQRAEEAQEQREQIAEDLQALIRLDVTQELPGGGILGASILIPGTSLGRLVRIDPNGGMEIRQSLLTSINVRTVHIIGNRIFAIAGENRGNSAIRLVELNADALTMERQGEDDITEESLLWVNGQNLYALTSDGANLYLARFSLNLELQARSQISIHPFATLLFSDAGVVTQRSDGTAVLLNAMDLRER